MKLKLALAAAAALFATSGAALAGDLVTATLEAPLASKEKVVAASLVWNCEGATCVALAQRPAGLRACRDLAKEVGRISAFGAETAKLEGDDITACNARARVASN